MSNTIYTVPEKWRMELWRNARVLPELDHEERWETIMIELLRPGPSGQNNGFFGKQHTKKWKLNASKRTSGKNNPMYGRKRGKECSNGGLYGKQNGMYGTKRGKECVNKRSTCPLCGMESNSSNIKRHITKTHNMDWKECLNLNS